MCFEQQAVKEFLVAGKELVRSIDVRQQQQHWLPGEESDGFQNQSRAA
jgi:phage anti-repressor protein